VGRLSTPTSQLLSKAIRVIWSRANSLEWQAWVTVVCAVIAMAYVQWTVPFFHPPGGDSDRYFYMARYILKIPGGVYVQERPPGMPLLLILSGVFFDTWAGLIAIFAAMSVAIPCLIYATLRRFGRNMAMMVALISILGMFAFAYSRLDASEHPFFFFEFLNILLISLWFKSPDRTDLPVWIAVIALVTNLIRPVSIILFWIFVACGLVRSDANRKALGLATLVYIALTAAWAIVDRNAGLQSLPGWSAPANRIERRFAEAYFQRQHFIFERELQGEPTIQENHGPASQQLYGAVRSFLIEKEPEWSNPRLKSSFTAFGDYSSILFGRYAGDPEALVQAVFTQPNSAYFQVIRLAAASKWGAQASSHLRAVAAEYGHTGIFGLLRFFLNRPSLLITGPLPPLGWRNALAVFYFAPRREAKSWNVLVRSDSVPRMMITADAGPYSREFLASVAFFASDFPTSWINTNPLMKRFGGDPERLVASFAEPGRLGYAPPSLMGDRQPEAEIMEGWFNTMFVNFYGPVISDQLFANVVRETLHKNPASFLFFLDNFLNEVAFIKKFAVTEDLSISNVTKSSDIYYDIRRIDGAGGPLPAGLLAKLPPKIEGDRNSHLIAFMYELFHLALPFIMLASVLFFPIAMLSESAPLAAFLGLMLVYLVAVLAIFGNFGAERYTDSFIMLPVMLAGLGIAATCRFAATRRLTRVDP
jgi:hypothetical protein